MLCAVLYLLCYDYHKFKKIFPFNHKAARKLLPDKQELNSKFPFKFFAGVFIVVLAVGLHTSILYTLLPRNTLTDCRTQCTGEKSTDACNHFCTCIHQEGKSLEICLDEYRQASVK